MKAGNFLKKHMFSPEFEKKNTCFQAHGSGDRGGGRCGQKSSVKIGKPATMDLD